MKITEIELKDFRPFEFSRINKLQVTNKDDITIITGRNGSGKTTFLSQLSPRSPAKSLYGKKGYRRLEIEHEGNYYTLIFDVSKNSKKSSSFLRNDIELNVSGTIPVQNDLVDKYFNFSELVKQVLYNEIKMCSLSRADRKSILFKINPYDLDLILNKHKDILRLIKETNAGLKLLYQRKTELESTVMSQDLLDEKYAHQKDLQDKLDQLRSDEYFLKNKKDLFKDTNTTDPDCIYLCQALALADLSNMKFVQEKVNEYFHIKELKQELNNFYRKYYYLDKEDNNILNNLRVQLGINQQNQINCNENIKTTADDKKEVEKTLKELQTTNAVVSKEQTLKELKQEYENYKYIVTPNVIFPEEEDTYYHNFVDDLIVKCTHLKSYMTEHGIDEVFDRETMKHIKKNITTLESTITNQTIVCDNYSNRLKEIADELNSIPNDPLVKVQQCDMCDYRIAFAHRRTQLENEKRDIGKKYGPVIDSRKKNREEKSRLNTLCENVNYCYNRITDIVNLVCNTNTYRITEEKVRRYCNGESGGLDTFINNISNSVNIQPSIRIKNRLEKQISDLENDLKHLYEAKQTSLSFLQDSIKKYKDRLDEEYDKLAIIEDSISSIKKDIDGYNKLCELKQKCAYVSKKIKLCYEYLYAKSTIMFIDKELSLILSNKNSTNDELIKVNTIIKEQEDILSKLKQETEAIEKLEKDKKIYDEIEFGISPETGFPHKAMVEYINVVIRNANVVLDSIWSYPIQILEAPLDEPLSFDFKVLLDDNVTVDDISGLSRGQQTIVNLAFTISFIYIMKLQNYPIFFDEVIEGLDSTHIQKALEWLRDIVDKNIVSQMFFINHDAVLNSGFSNCDIVCISDPDADLPTNTNVNVKKE